MSDFRDQQLRHHLDDIFYFNNEKDREKQEREREKKEERKNRKLYPMFEGGKR